MRAYVDMQDAVEYCQIMIKWEAGHKISDNYYIIIPIRQVEQEHAKCVLECPVQEHAKCDMDIPLYKIFY